MRLTVAINPYPALGFQFFSILKSGPGEIIFFRIACIKTVLQINGTVVRQLVTGSIGEYRLMYAFSLFHANFQQSASSNKYCLPV